MIDLDHEKIAADIEYSKDSSGEIEILGCSFANNGQSIYVTNHDQILDTFDYLHKNQIISVWHWGFFDFSTMYKYGWRLPRLKVEDTSFIYPEKLQDLAAKLLNRRRMSFTEAAGYGTSSSLFESYAKGDSEDTISLSLLEIPEEYTKLDDYELKCDAVQAMGEISNTGIPIVLDNCYEQLEITEAIIEELHSWIKHELGSASAQKIRKHLEQFYHKDLAFTENNSLSTSINNCWLLKRQDELVEFIYVWKLLKSFKTKYVMPFIEAGEETGRYHGTYTQIRKDHCQRVPFSIGDFYEIKNSDVRNGLNTLDFDSQFLVEIEKIDGLKEFNKLTDYARICNFTKTIIWRTNEIR